MPRKWYQGEFIRIEAVTPVLRRFWLEVEGVEHFDFQPGQFITMDLPVGTKRLDRWKSYSIANAPDGKNIIELCIVNMEDGKGTDYLFNEVELGTKVKFKGPEGKFVLPQDLTKDITMICTGTGIAPFRSMIQYIHDNQRSYRSIHLIFGTRYEASILYRKELEKLAEANDNFKYTICLSREEHWDGHKGYVHDVYLSDCDPENRIFYLCGWSQMIDEAVVNLTEKCKVDRKHIIYELYG